MALTVSIPSPAFNQAGAYSAIQGKYALLIGDVAYPLGGYAVTPGTFGYSSVIQSITVLELTQIPSGYFPVWDGAYQKVRFLQLAATPTGPMNEAATGTNLSAVQVTCQVFGW